MIQILPLSEIVVEYPSKPVPAMVRQMREHHFSAPMGAVYANGHKPRFTLATGARRVASARAAGLTEGAFEVLGEGANVDELRIAENANRSENIPVQFRSVMRLMDEGLTVKQIGQRTGASVSKINKWLRLRGLCEQLFACLERNEISADCAIEASTLSKEKQAQALEMHLALMREGKHLTSTMVRQLRRVEVDEALAELDIDALESPEAQVPAGRVDVRAALSALVAAVESGGVIDEALASAKLALR